MTTLKHHSIICLLPEYDWENNFFVIGWEQANFSAFVFILVQINMDTFVTLSVL